MKDFPQVTQARGHLPTSSLQVVGLLMPLWSVSLSSSLCLACLPVRMFLLWLHLRLISPALSLALQWPLSGVESQCSSGAEPRMISSWQTVLMLDLFAIPSWMLIESRTQNGSLWLGFAPIWVAFHCQMLVTLGDGFALAMDHIMIFQAELGRGQHHTIWRFLLTPSWKKTSWWLVENKYGSAYKRNEFTISFFKIYLDYNAPFGRLLPSSSCWVCLASGLCNLEIVTVTLWRDLYQ